MNKIFLAPTTFALFSKQPLILFAENKYKIYKNQTARKLLPNEIVEFAVNVTGIIAGTELYTQEVFEKLSALKVISRLGVGMDNIDLEAASQNNIKIYNTQTTPAPAVAELVIGLMIDVARNISKSDHALKTSHWEKEMGSLLQGKTLGIIGLGTIGKTIVELVDGFNFNILAHDLNPDDNFKKKYGVTYCDLNRLLEESDIVSVHLNLSKQTHKLISKDQISRMKSDAILINTSRGEIIDENALFNALKKEKLAGAGLDVFEHEPYFGSLSELDNIVLTPHIGAYAKEVRIKMEIEAAENLIRGLHEE